MEHASISVPAAATAKEARRRGSRAGASYPTQLRATRWPRSSPASGRRPAASRFAATGRLPTTYRIPAPDMHAASTAHCRWARSPSAAAGLRARKVILANSGRARIESSTRGVPMNLRHDAGFTLARDDDRRRDRRRARHDRVAVLCRVCQAHHRFSKRSHASPMPAPEWSNISSTSVLMSMMRVAAAPPPPPARAGDAFTLTCSGISPDVHVYGDGQFQRRHGSVRVQHRRGRWQGNALAAARLVADGRLLDDPGGRALRMSPAFRDSSARAGCRRSRHDAPGASMTGAASRVVRGMFLLEALVALVVFSLGIAGLLGIVGAGAASERRRPMAR